MQTLKTLTPLTLALGLVAVPLTAPLARPASTLHIEVIEERGAEPAVKLSMPMDVIAAFAGSIRGEEYSPAGVLDEMTEEGFDLRAFWKEIREGNVNEFLTLEAEDAHVRAWRDGGQFRVTVEAEESSKRDRFNGRTRVEIRLPEELMNYLVEESGPARPEELVEILRRMGPMTLVEVISEDESVRIWLD